MIARSAARVLVLALIALGVCAAPAVAVPVVSGEFQLNNEVGTNNKIVAGPDGNIWLTLQTGKDVARLTPGGQPEEFDLEANDPQGIAVGPNGTLWITREAGVTSFDPTDPEKTFDATTINDIEQFHSIVLGPDGNLWVATKGKLIRISPADPSVNESFEVTDLDPRDIDVAGGLLAVADFNGSRIVTATPTDPPAVTSYPLLGGSQGVAGDAAGRISFSQQQNQPTEFGLLAPPGPPILTQSPDTDPFGVALGPDGAFWIAQFTTDTLTRLTTDNQASPLGSSFAAGSGPRHLTAGPGNTLWVTLDNTDKVGRVIGVDPPVVTPPPKPTTPAPSVKRRPRTQIKGGPKGRITTRWEKRRIKFRFASPDFGVHFQCRMKQLPPRKARKGFRSPAFRGCKSPRPYLLKPGRYRFEVRAIFEGGRRDLSPAKRNFRIVRVGM